MKVLVVTPTQTHLIQERSELLAYRERALKHAAAYGDEVIHAADYVDGTLAGRIQLASEMRSVGYVASYVDHGKDAAMIMVERMAERHRIHVETRRIPHI